MPTRPTKGDHGTADAGSKGRGGQKATQGSAVSEDVAEGRRDVGLDQHTDVGTDRDDERAQRPSDG